MFCTKCGSKLNKNNLFCTNCGEALSFSQDLYDILGVQYPSSKEEIKRAYHILAHQFHPDKNNGNDKRFKKINEAYRVLSNEKSKSEYDRNRVVNSDKNTTKNSNTDKEESSQPESKFDYKTIATTIFVILAIIGLTNVLDNANKTISSDGDFSNISNGITKAPADVVPILDTVKKDVPIITHEKTNAEICKDMNGVNGTYNSLDNTCGCSSGYFYGADSKQCVSLVQSRDESCSVKYPNTSFLKYDNDGKTNICDCNPGYLWNNEMTACLTQSALSQQCTVAYGTGSYSTKENGKNVCDCSYGYSWNAQRNSCVSTESISQICVRDVGRNSYYKGTITNGKYDCSEPY